MQEIFNKIREYLAAGEQAAVATVVWASGSSPRAVGAKMAVCSDLRFSGSVSGGCVESAVVQEALAVMQSGQPKLVHYGISDETAQSVGLACGGEIEVWIEAVVKSPNRAGLTPKMLAEMQDLLDKEILFYALTKISGRHSGQKALFIAKGGSLNIPEPDWLDTENLQQLMAKPTTKMITIKENRSEARVFFEAFPPKSRLVVIGAVHIAVALISFAKELGYKTIVIDPRKAFATFERLAHADVIMPKWPQEALKEIKLKPSDCVAVISHDEKIDLPALEICLQSPIGYIGLLGSLKTRKERFDALSKMGFEEQDLARIHAPIGLNIGAQTPEEIALAVMAEIVKDKRGNNG